MQSYQFHPQDKTTSILNCWSISSVLRNELFLFMSPLAPTGHEGQSCSLSRTALGSISDHCFLILGYPREVFGVLFSFWLGCSSMCVCLVWVPCPALHKQWSPKAQETMILSSRSLPLHAQSVMYFSFWLPLFWKLWISLFFAWNRSLRSAYLLSRLPLPDSPFLIIELVISWTPDYPVLSLYLELHKFPPKNTIFASQDFGCVLYFLCGRTQVKFKLQLIDRGQRRR